MIQVWVLPETPGEPAAYQIFQAGANRRTRVYGGPADQDETFAARTVIEIAHMDAGQSVEQPGLSVVYVTVGEGTSGGETVKEGDLIETRDFDYKAVTDSKLILAYEI
jgi:hypothetical protein